MTPRQPGWQTRDETTPDAEPREPHRTDEPAPTMSGAPADRPAAYGEAERRAGLRRIDCSADAPRTWGGRHR